MSHKADVALRALLSGQTLVHETGKYILSQDGKICKVVQQDGLNYMEDTEMSLANFIKMCKTLTKESLFSASLGSHH